MPLPSFDDLPFNKRPDLTPYLLHLTKNTNATDKFSAFDNLVNILKLGKVFGSDRKGFIRGPNKAACFMDVPFASLKYVLTPENTAPSNPRYEACGVIITKTRAYKKGCRPVLYLSEKEIKSLRIPKDELWRVVKLELLQDGWINWIHEREWRCKGAFKLPKTIHAAIVRNTNEAKRLREIIHDEPKDFKCIPDSILPATVICQGLLK